MTPPERFVPALGVGGPHRQTLVARFLRSAEGPLFTRERFETPDDDFLDVDWGPDPGPTAPLVLILHGLEGSSRRRYVRSVARGLLLRGVRPVALSFRGCSGQTNHATRFYHSGETEDPAWLMARIRERYPERRLGAMGFSLGGNVLLKLLGERSDGGTGLVDAAVAMSVPYDLDAGCSLLERSRMGVFYSTYFLRSLKRKVAGKAHLLRDVVDVEAAARTDSIRAFDEVVTAPLNGFASAEDYYARCSSDRFLPGIRTPTLLLHAEDDPFLPRGAIPVSAARANPAIELRLEPHGGHVGFLAGTLRRPHFWADEWTAHFLAEQLMR